MGRVFRRKRTWIAVLALVALGAIVPWAVLGSGKVELSVTPYSDLIRFEARGVASLQVSVFDLSGRLLWESGIISGEVVDWTRVNEDGERVGYGTYIYLVLGWNAQGEKVLQSFGKLRILPSDKVQLLNSHENFPAEPERRLALQWLSPDSYVDIRNTNGASLLRLYGSDVGYGAGDIRIFDNDVLIGRILASGKYNYVGFIGLGSTEFRVYTRNSAGTYSLKRLRITGNADVAKASFLNCNLGIETIAPSSKVHIVNDTNQSALKIEASDGTNLIEGYNTGTGIASGLIFRVERESGNVRTDGAFYGAGFYSGGADIAEYINTSEPVEPGDVVEIDPNNPGRFRKARGPFSSLVAGIISADPGVTLGSNADPVKGGTDFRPRLALAGRVFVKATTENGAINIGDLLVAASKPGYAMRCKDPTKAIGKIIGRALEPLEEGEGLILIQIGLQ